MKISPDHVLGTILGSALTILVTAAFDTDVAANVAERAGEMFAIFAVLFSGWLAYRGAIMNIEKMDERQEAQRKSKLIAARARLPLALSMLSQQIEEALPVCVGDRGPPATNAAGIYDALKLPKEIIDIISECIAHADDNDSAWLAAILRTHQIVVSRTTDNFSNPDINAKEASLNSAQQGALFDWLRMKMLVGHLYDYARFKVDKIPNTSERSPKTFLLFDYEKVINDAQYAPRLLEMVERLEKTMATDMIKAFK